MSVSADKGGHGCLRTKVSVSTDLCIKISTKCPKNIFKWEGDALHNLKTIAGYNNCDSSSENSMMNCLRDLDQYDLLKFSHKEGVRQCRGGVTGVVLFSLTNQLTLEKEKLSIHQ